MTEKLSLTELQLIIRDSLYIALPDMYWVIAEISEITENAAGHCYLELIEKQPDEKNVRARARGIIWSSRYRFLKSLFENITGESLREGLNILIKIKVEYHELYGLSLVISDIDPAFTIGEMAMKRNLIIRKLEEEGIFSMNKELALPSFPQRIAIVSSRNSAGYSDFINHLSNNSFRYCFYTSLFESAMQGSETENGIIGALDRIALNSHHFDIVVIIRGGGSQSDLSWFDNYNIAYHVTQFPLPVLTGIGHDKDMSVTDLVANKALKTPTAVADFLIDSMGRTENELIEMYTVIKELSRNILEKNRIRIETDKNKLSPLALNIISRFNDKLSGKKIAFINVGKEFIYRAGSIPLNQKSRLISLVKSLISEKKTGLKRSLQDLVSVTGKSLNYTSSGLALFETTLGILNPENVLRRGYTITSLNGKIVKERILINPDDIIDTQFSDGKVTSRVIEKKD
jgi:exodeoxyribonuclease VII large subunit